MPMAASLRRSSSIAAVSFWIEPGGRLVERQHRGTGRKRARDLDQTLVDVGQRTCRLIEFARIADKGEQALRDGEHSRRRAVPRQSTWRPVSRAAARSETLSMTDTLSNSWLV